MNKLASLVVSASAIMAGPLLGGALGWNSGVNTIRSIAEAATSKGEFVCGTGFPAIVIGYTLIGIVLGALPGFILAIGLYLRKGQRKKGDVAAYYGE